MASPAKIQKFGTQTEKGKIIHAFRNGDKHQASGVRMVIHPTKVKSYDQLKAEMSKKVGLPTGPVLKVYTADRKQVKNLEDFEDGGLYICTGAEKLKEDAIPVGISAALEARTTASSSPPPQSGESSSSSAPVEEKKTVVSAYAKGTPEKFGTQTEKGKVITCYRNADKHHSGVRITIHSTKFKNYDQLKDAMTRLVQVPTGPVKKVYTVDGKQVKTLDAFEDGGKYICGGPEPFNTPNVPTAALS